MLPGKPVFAAQHPVFLNNAINSKRIIRLALPISLALAIPQVSFLTNTAFLGRLGEQELGVNGISGIFYLTLSMIGYGLSNGVQIQMARREGERDARGLAQTWVNGAMLSLLFSLGLMLLSLWLAPIIFGFSLRDADNALLNVSFLFVRVWGLPFLMLTQMTNAFFIAIQKSKYLIAGSLVGTLTNIIMDYALIFGHFGFPELGLTGAALASVIGEAAFCTTMLVMFFGNSYYKTYPVKPFLHFDLERSQQSLRVALPLIVQFLFSIGGWQVFFIFIEHLGNRELAASQILRSIFGIMGIGTWAMASTSNTMVSHVIGQGRSQHVLPLIRKIALMSLVYAVVVSTLLLLFDDQFLALYRDDPSLIAFAKPSLRIIIAATLIMALSTVTFNGVVGTGNTLVNLLTEVTCVLVYLIYCYITIQRFRLGLEWAWGSEFVYWITLLTISGLYLKSGKWKGKKI